jgi:predicted ABC-type ATPase
MRPELYILAGANGSGKSTISKLLLPRKDLVFINPDDIAYSICPSNPPSVKIQAGRQALEQMQTLLARNQSFAIETTLSGRAHLDLIQKAHAQGYFVSLVYSFVDSVEVCVARIASRVLSGGHHVPEEDVRRRYARSKQNFLNLYRSAVDEWVLYYNGDSAPTMVATNSLSKGEHILSQQLFDLFKEDL